MAYARSGRAGRWLRVLAPLAALAHWFLAPAPAGARGDPVARAAAAAVHGDEQAASALLEPRLSDFERACDHTHENAGSAPEFRARAQDDLLAGAREAVDAVPGNLHARVLLGGLLIECARYGDAARELELALRAGWDERLPAAFPAGVLFGLAHLGIGDLPVTVRWWSRAARAGAPPAPLLARWIAGLPPGARASATDALATALRKAGTVPRPALRAAVGQALAVLCTTPAAIEQARTAYRSLPEDDRRWLERVAALSLAPTAQEPTNPPPSTVTHSSNQQRDTGARSAPPGPLESAGPSGPPGTPASAQVSPMPGHAPTPWSAGTRDSLVHAFASGAGLTAADAPAPAPGAIRFVEAASRARLFFRHGARPPTVSILQVMGSGVGVFDLDGDGQDDLVLGDSAPLALVPPSPPAPGATTLALAVPDKARAHPRLFRARGDGTFDDVTGPSGLEGPLQGTGVLAADLDGDGYPDLVLTGNGEVRFLHNSGDGTFGPWSTPLPSLPPRWWTGVTAGPLLGPDRLDLYICAYIVLDPTHIPLPDPRPGEWFPNIDTMTPTHFAGQPGVLLANRGALGFVDATPPPIARSAMKGLGALIADLTGDGRPDLFLVNDMSGNRLLATQPDGTLADVSARAWINERHGSMGIDLADLDGDGREDLAITNWWDEGDSLLLQKQPGRFVDAASPAQLLEPTRLEVAWGIAAVDLDGDGLVDLFQVAGHTQHTDFTTHGVYSIDDWPDPQAVQVYRNTGRSTFEDRTEDAGLDDLPRQGRGLAILDADGDGRPDVVVTTLGEAPALFLNRTEGGSWLWVDLVGTLSNRAGCGATVVLTEDSPSPVGPPARQVRQSIVRPGYLSSSPPRVIFGRGPHPGPARLSIHWPSGLDQRLSIPAGTRLVRIVERKAP